MKAVHNKQVTLKDITWDSVEEEDCDNCPCHDCYDCGTDYCTDPDDPCEYSHGMCWDCPMKVLL